MSQEEIIKDSVIFKLSNKNVDFITCEMLVNYYREDILF